MSVSPALMDLRVFLRPPLKGEFVDLDGLFVNVDESVISNSCSMSRVNH